MEHREMAKGALINTLGVLARVSRALYFVIVARLFGSEIFGFYLLTAANIDIFSKIAGVGLDWGALRLTVQLRAQGREREIRSAVYRIAGLSFSVSLCVATIVAWVSSIIARDLLKKEHLEKPLFYLCASIPMMTITSLLLFALRAGKKMQYEVYVRSVVEPLVLLIGGIMAYFIYPGIEGLIGAHLLAALSAFFLTSYFFRKFYPKDPLRTKAAIDWRGLLSYSIPMGGMDLFNVFKQRLDVMMIGRFLPFSHVAIYGAVNEIGNLVKKIRQIFEPIFMPIASHFHETDEKERLHDHFVRAMRWILLAALALVMPMLFAPDQFLRVFRPEFVEGSKALMFVAIGMLFYVTIGLSESVLSMTGYAYLNLINAGVLLGINFILHLILIPRYGIVGAGFATGISYMVISVIRLIVTHRFVKVHPFGKSQVKPIVAGVLGLIVAWLARQLYYGSHLWTLGVVVPLFFLIYGFTLKALGLEPEDYEILERLKAKFRYLRKNLNLNGW